MCKIIQKTAKIGVFWKLRLWVLKKKIFKISFQLLEDNIQHEYLKFNKLLLVKVLQLGAKVGKIAKEFSKWAKSEIF